MKILCIRGRNIASLEGDFTVDFTLEPLRSAPLFAITGATGSGKSTLLDVICLALYDATPRTSIAKENNVNISDVGGKSLSQNDTRSLLRRGSSEAYAEVDFVALSGKKYRARWSVRRARDRADGSLQAVEIRLFNLENMREEQGGKTDLLNKIQDLVGLSFEQFKRSVLLAQGDFATFLKAKQNEKAEILEKLTGTEIYSVISSKIYVKNKEAAEELAKLKGKIDREPLLMEEQREEMSKERLSIEQEAAKMQMLSEDFASNLTWLNQLKDILNNIERAEQDKTDLDKKKKEFELDLKELIRIEKANEVRSLFSDWKRDRKLKIEKQEAFDKSKKYLQQNLPQLQVMLNKAKELQLHKNEWDKLFRDELQPKIDKAKSIDVKREEKRNHIKALELKLRESEEQSGQHNKKIAENNKAIIELESRLKEEANWLIEHKSNTNIIAKKETILDNVSKMLRINESQVKNVQKLEEYKLGFQKGEIQLEEMRKELEEWSKILPEEVLILRRKLVDGKACPVCGSLVHPIKTEVEWAEVEEQDQLQMSKDKQIEEKRADLSKQIEALTLLLSNNTLGREHLSEKIEELKEAYEELFNYMNNSLLGYCSNWEALLKEGKLPETLDAIENEYNKHLSNKEKAEENLQKLRSTKDIYQTRLQDLHLSIKAMALELENLLKELSLLDAKYKELWQNKPLAEVEAFYRKERETIESNLKQAESDYHNLNAEVKRNEALAEKGEQEIEILHKEEKQKEAELREWLLSNVEIGGGENLQKLLEKTPSEVQLLQNKRKELEEKETTIAAVLKEREQNLLQHLPKQSKQPKLPKLIEDVDINAMARSEIQDKIELKYSAITSMVKENTIKLETLRLKLAEIEMKLKQDAELRKKIKDVEKEIQAMQAKSDRWASLNELLGSSDGSKFKLIAQAYTLDFLLGYANAQLKNLSKRYELQRVGDSLALQVIDLDMLGEARSVHTLSGGESFLVSLALALALSALSSNRMKVESLFIDEGFGSLDADTLQMAMEALEQLHTQGRKIGVISHVAEMTEKIACRILVEPTMGGCSRVFVLGAN